MKDLLRNKHFISLLIGRVLSITADSLIFMILLKWLEMNSTDEGAFTWFYIAFFLPAAFFSIPIGTWVERKYLQNVMIWSVVVRSIILLSFLLFFSHISSIWVYIYIVAEATVSLFFFPANQSLLPHIVEKKSLSLANSILQLGFIIMRSVGYMAATFFISKSLSVELSLTFALILLILSIPFTMRIKPLIKNEGGDNETFWLLMKEGIQYIGKQKILRSLFLLFALAWVVASSIDLVILAYIKEVLQKGVENFTYFTISVFLGMITGAVFAPTLYRKYEQKWFMVMPLFVYSLTVLSMNLSTDLKVILPLFFLGGVSLSLFEVIFLTYVQETVIESQYARTFSFYNMIFNFMPLPGILLFGGFIHSHGITSVIYFISVFLLVTGVIGVLLLPRLKQRKK